MILSKLYLRSSEKESYQGHWARQQAICADVVFRRRTFWGMIRYYVWKRIKAIVPIEVKDRIKIWLGIIKC